MKVTFSEAAFEDYVAWQKEDKRTLNRINALIKSIQRDGLMKGIGKPEKLKHNDRYSRRIDEKNRLVYKTDDNANLLILSCKDHYVD